MDCLSGILMLFVEDHCRGSGEADAHPCGLVYFILGEAFFPGFFQVCFRKGIILKTIIPSVAPAVLQRRSSDDGVRVGRPI